jgi:hypothetical protein
MAKEQVLNSHAPHGPESDEPDPDALATATVGIVGTLLVVIIVVFVQGLYLSVDRREYERKVVDQAPAELRSLRAAQNARLQSTGWVDKGNGVVAIPIRKAMELLAKDPDPAAPIIVPETPAPAQAPAVAVK